METEVDWDEIGQLMATPGLHPNVKEFCTGVTTLHRAAYAGQAEVLLWCLNDKGDVNARTLMGRSPLHYACDGTQPRCIRLLVEHKADSNIRTLSYLTPLHLCCQGNSIEAVNAILCDKGQVVDIDAEDTLHRRPEAMTQDKQILRVIRKYRATLDDRRKAQLVEQCLLRLFKFFDVNGDGWIHPEEWVDTMTLLAEYFEHHCDTSIEDLFKEADKDSNGYIDWDEFKASHVDLLKVINVPFRGLMDTLADIDRAMFQEKVQAEKEAVGTNGRKSLLAVKSEEDEEDGQADVSAEPGAAPEAAFLRTRGSVLSPKAKVISSRRKVMQHLKEGEGEAGSRAAERSSIPGEEVSAEDVLPPEAPRMSLTLTPSPMDVAIPSGRCMGPSVSPEQDEDDTAAEDGQQPTTEH
eukprot:TRINITY_DN29272_c0_g1_i1.p1 TRINITY_DN29272_c0_g1~~TRINITY_DN29272_c0_g1_i1.p1  ORF type:complete len:408 (-),score=78.84 TRINITY_DN29272_c0_g1_i1:63-1286(-)